MATTVSGVEMLVKPTMQKSQGESHTEKTDDGFQKLLDSKAQEDAGLTPAEAPDKETEETVNITEAVDERPTADTEKAETEAELTISNENILTLVPAAFLVQMGRQEETASVKTEGVFIVPEAETATVQTVQPLPTEVQALPEKPEQLQETLKTDLDGHIEKFSGEKPEQPVHKSEQKAASETTEKERLADTVQDNVKTETVQTSEKKPEQNVQVVVQVPEQLRDIPGRMELPSGKMTVRKPEELPEKLVNHMLTRLTSGQKEFEVQLEPYDLGKILIKVAFDKESATVSIICSESKTMDLMAKNARELGAILENNLGTPTMVYVEDKETGYLEQQGNGGRSGYDQGQEQQKQNKKSKENESIDFLQQLRLGLI